MSLSDKEIDQLEELLFCDDIAEDTLDYFGLHGLVCASIVGPVEVSSAELCKLALGGEIPNAIAGRVGVLETSINKINEDIRENLAEGSPIYLPYEEEDEHYDAALESWCAGFIEGFFVNEEQWFEKDEEVAAELLLPYMALSGLFHTDDFSVITKNKKLMQQLEGIVGEQLTDVFLFYHSD